MFAGDLQAVGRAHCGSRFAGAGWSVKSRYLHRRQGSCAVRERRGICVLVSTCRQ